VNQWAIGIYTGETPFQLRCSNKTDTPVLTGADVADVRARFVADPFMLAVDRRWYMFFEVMNVASQKGEIGLAVSGDGSTWAYQKIVLTEPFHLSYPYVFEWGGDYYMIPETHQTNSVRLYQARYFPWQWSYVRTLLTGSAFADASVVRHEGKWWMFTETNPTGRSDTLRLYYADDLSGAWREHPQSPIVQGNPHTARPAGRVVVFDEHVIRYTQDCYPRYGTQVRAFAVTELTTRRYGEKEACKDPILVQGGDGAWNADGMHHLDPHRLMDGTWIACVDGHRKT
jgi:hypothetical protein